MGFTNGFDLIRAAQRVSVGGSPGAAVRRNILVALAIAFNQQEGVARPSQQYLCEVTEYSARATRNAIKELEGLGLISRSRSYGGYAQRRADAYQLHLEVPVDNSPLPAQGAASLPAGGAASLPAQDDSITGTSGHFYRHQVPVRTAKNSHKNSQVKNLTAISATESYPQATTFERFWEVWPRKDGRKAALTAWGAAIKRASPELIVERASAYAEHPHRPPKQFVPYGATWLRGDRWNDPLPEAPEAERRRPSPTERARAILALAAKPAEQEIPWMIER
jgi:hypothetical protein